MDIVNLQISDIKPYENNPRHNDGAVEAVANSIKEFGFLVPCVIGKDNVLITGHTRVKACKRLGITEVPCVRAESLTDEQIKAFRLADNKVAEIATWDFELLNQELEGIFSINMEDFGFEIDEFDFTPDYGDVTQGRVENIENLAIGQYEGDGKYDIPIITGTKDVPEVTEWIGFNYVLSDTNPEGKGVHFFVDDYQFERIWNDPPRYMEKLQAYTAVLAPDFSPYGDMPLALQIFNHYRKHWCAAYWQDSGINVIPTVRASTDPRSLEFYLDGEPRESVVAFSTMWAKLCPDELRQEYETMVRTLRPSHILVYGEVLDYMDSSIITRIPKFTEKRFKNGEA